MSREWVRIEDIWLIREGGENDPTAKAVVLVKVGGVYKRVIEENVHGPFSHCVHAGGILNAPVDPVHNKPGDVEKQFPIQGDYKDRVERPPGTVPWSIAEQAYSVYSSKYGRGQSLERLAERGGFGHGEMDMWAPEGWHQHFRVRTSLE